MPDWPALLRLLDDVTSLDRLNAWFAAVAERLLNGTELLIARQVYRLVEIEFYLFHIDHPDPFTHRESMQFQCGRWYFHRTGGSYRAGSFKGFDLSFGDGTFSGGILIRSLATPDGSVIVGPSLCVDHLLGTLGVESVAELDRLIGGRVAWDADNPLSLRQTEPAERRELLRTARVGLSLKKATTTDLRTRYLMRPYRYLSEPRKVRKGKRHMVLALHARGHDADTIRHVTGCPMVSIQRYVADYEAGRQERDFTPYFGIEARPRDWCRLYGLCQRMYG